MQAAYTLCFAVSFALLERTLVYGLKNKESIVSLVTAAHSLLAMYHVLQMQTGQTCSAGFFLWSALVCLRDRRLGDFIHAIACFAAYALVNSLPLWFLLNEASSPLFLLRDTMINMKASDKPVFQAVNALSFVFLLLRLVLGFPIIINLIHGTPSSNTLIVMSAAFMWFLNLLWLGNIMSSLPTREVLWLLVPSCQPGTSSWTHFVEKLN